METMTVNIKDVNREAWNRFKAAVYLNGETIQTAFNKLIEQYASSEGGKTMKTEYDYGRKYAEFMSKHGENGPVNINDMVGGSVDIPEGDYCAMRDDGIVNPDAREYWRGYNSVFED